MIQHLIFDLDRTVYPADTRMSEDISYRIKRFASEFWGLDFEEGARQRAEAVKEYGTTLDWLVTAGGFADIEAYFAAIHPADECIGLYKTPALRPLLESLPQKKMILTNSPYEHADRVLNFLGVRDLFDSICDIRANNLKGKPAAGAFQKALEMCGGTLENSIFLDDAEGYTDGWARLGGTAILVCPEGKRLNTPDLPGKTYWIKDIYGLPAVLDKIERGA
ncbi:MAG: HAD hydrolase-like protein [Treponema sp.]|nr:HAD hydrolase-like protein [Treponema sp.]